MERGEQTESGNTTPFLAETHLLFPVMPLSITSPRRRRLSVIRNSSHMVPSSIASRSSLTTRAFYSVLLVSGCVEPRINGEQRSPLAVIRGAGGDSERRVGV